MSVGASNRKPGATVAPLKWEKLAPYPRFVKSWVFFGDGSFQKRPYPRVPQHHGMRSDPRESLQISKEPGLGKEIVISDPESPTYRFKFENGDWWFSVDE